MIVFGYKQLTRICMALSEIISQPGSWLYSKSETIQRRILSTASLLIQYMSVMNQGCPSDIHGLVTVQLSDFTREFKIGDIRMILSQAHLIPETDSC